MAPAIEVVEGGGLLGLVVLELEVRAVLELGVKAVLELGVQVAKREPPLSSW